MRRRCCSWAAAVEMVMGNGGVGPEVLFDRLKRLVKVCEVIELRRGREEASVGAGWSLLLLLLADIMAES